MRDTRKRAAATRRGPAAPEGGTHGLARVLSKRGLCSRTQAARWIAEGRVRVDGRLVRDPEARTHADAAIVVAGLDTAAAVERRYVMLDKPRGLVTTTADEQGRDTVYRAFDGAGLPWLAPVGRLDKASEGLLLFTNDPVWAAAVTSPEHGPDKTYHVQVDALLDPAAVERLRGGVVDAGERLAARHVRELRRGTRNSWLEIVLDEGRNRQIRRLLAAHGIGVLRLVRVAIGALELGTLPRGAWRELSPDEVRALAMPAGD